MGWFSRDLSGAIIRDTLIGVLRPLSKMQTHVKATGPTKAPGLLPNPEERKGLREAQHVAHSHPSQAHRAISASLEGSGSTLERVTHLRLARGQRTCPRAGGQSPPRSRTADLPSSGWPISASLEALSRHKGQTAPPPNRRTKALKASHSTTAQRAGGVRLPLPQWM